jgi:hypothetical protein
MASPSPKPVDSSDAELKGIVTKDSEDRLKAELLRGQDYFSEARIHDMTKAQLVLYVVALRKLAGTKESVKTMISGYDPEKMGLKLPEKVHIPSTGNPMLAIMQFLAMQAEKEARLEEERREERKRKDQKEAKLEL